MSLPSKSIPAQHILRQYFDYIPDTGDLIWRDTPNVNKRVRGKIAGTILNSGYRSIFFKKKVYLAHRLIWTWMTGDDPGQAIIDHINEVKDDNRWENLRLSDWSKNMENMRNGRPRGRKLAEPNISMQDNSFRVQIKRSGVRYRACFKSMEAAVAYRDEIIAGHSHRS